jgi:hypothetical protein
MSICPSADSTPFSSLKPCTLKALLAAIVSTPAVADPPRDHLTTTRPRSSGKRGDQLSFRQIWLRPE